MTKAKAAPDPMDQWRAERKAHRIAMLTDRMPPAYATSGELHAGVAGWVKALADGGTPNLALVGDTGTGKTWHVWHAALAALHAGWDGRVDVVTADDFRARVAPGKDADPFAAIVLMADAGLLVLDDVGAHRATDWWLEAVYAVINRRWEQLLPTVLTSNVTDLRAELNDRIASRLARDLVVVVLDGPDRRRT